MPEILWTRANALAEIRRQVGYDPWAVKYALLLALQELDLGGVNRVLESLERLEKDPSGASRTRLQLLLQERWG